MKIAYVSVNRCTVIQIGKPLTFNHSFETLFFKNCRIPFNVAGMYADFLECYRDLVISVFNMCYLLATLRFSYS